MMFLCVDSCNNAIVSFFLFVTRGDGSEFQEKLEKSKWSYSYPRLDWGYEKVIPLDSIYGFYWYSLFVLNFWPRWGRVAYGTYWGTTPRPTKSWALMTSTWSSNLSWRGESLPLTCKRSLPSIHGEPKKINIYCLINILEFYIQGPFIFLIYL